MHLPSISIRASILSFQTPFRIPCPLRRVVQTRPRSIADGGKAYACVCPYICSRDLHWRQQYLTQFRIKQVSKHCERVPSWCALNKRLQPAGAPKETRIHILPSLQRRGPKRAGPRERARERGGGGSRQAQEGQPSPTETADDGMVDGPGRTAIIFGTRARPTPGVP
eukprot:5707674-Pyramimonas_sp.AAC.1